MDMSEFLRRKVLEKRANSPLVPVEQISYDIAYFLLPQYIYGRFEEIESQFQSSHSSFGYFFYIMACHFREVPPIGETALTYRAHKGDFDGQSFLALEYPTTRPESESFMILEDALVPVILAPYFSVILFPNDCEPSYYILGQSPNVGRTTVRTVTREGSNCNLGVGPEPELDLFLDSIRRRRERFSN